MKLVTKIFIIILAISFSSCDISQTKEMELPEIEGGQMPAYDVDWADVDVGTKTKMVTVPKVVVVTEEVEVEVPYVDVDIPNNGDKEEITLIAEVEVKGEMHNIDISKVYASQNNLYVISNLTATGEKLDNEGSVRISDRLILNAPDLNIKHFIIGKRPNGDHNNQYKYISSVENINDKISKAKLIYNN